MPSLVGLGFHREGVLQQSGGHVKHIYSVLSIFITLVLKSGSKKVKKTDFGATVCKMVPPMLSDRCLSCLSVCLSVTLVYCG